jgi:ankyrin repeat protein
MGAGCEACTDRTLHLAHLAPIAPRTHRTSSTPRTPRTPINGRPVRVNDLNSLRKEARFWLKQVRSHHSGFTKRLRLAYPGAPAEPALRDIQHALAREHGDESWKALAARIGAGPMPALSAAAHGDPVSSFLRFACWDHRVHGRGDYRGIESAAMRLLDKHPDIPSADIYTATVCGNRAHVERLLAERPSLADQKGGVRHWEPLLYLCYARLPLASLRDNAVDIAELLLDAAANPNAYFMAGHSVYGALVGVAGEGEQDAPPHPARDELYRLLLERGAEPYDIQVLYNTHFRGDVMWWLKLTWDYSVAAGREQDWADPELPIFDMGGYGTGARFLLWLAIQKNNRELVEWLLARGANPNAAPPRAQNLPQMSLYRYAILEGRDDIATLLHRHGALPDEIRADDEAFVAACVRMDREAVAAMARAHPDYLRTPHFLLAASERNRADVVSLLLDLGTPVNIQDGQQRTALHAAAGHGAHDAAKVLLARGADPNLREAQYRATPLGFAGHYDDRAMIDLLTPYSRDVWALAAQGNVGRLREVLAAEPQRTRDVESGGRTLLWFIPDNDEPSALEVVDVLLACGVDPAVRAKDGSTAATSARSIGLDRVAARLERAASAG